MTELDLNDKNKATVMLVQALWGAISPNFRMVALGFFGPVWELLFVLEGESDSDREEIDDVVAEFDALVLGSYANAIEFKVKIVIDGAPLELLDLAIWRIVFRRREG